VWEVSVAESVLKRGVTLQQQEAIMRVHALAIGVLAGLACSTAGQAADDGSRFAAIWEKAGGPAFVARHGLNSQQYQQEFDKLTGQGFCLTDVSGYAVGGQAHFAAIWERKSCPAFVARHGLTSQQYQQEFDKLVGQQGFRLKLVDGYNVGGQDHYAAIWEKISGPAFVARHGLTSQQYQQEFDKLTGQGFCLIDVSGYEVGGQAHFAAIWEQKSCPAFVARHGLTSQQYQQEFDKLVGQQGFRLKLVDGYKVGGQDHFAAIWEKTSGPEFVARHGLTSDGYQQEFDKLLSQGFRLKLVSGY
jgi:polyglycine hydrolase-like protein